MGSGGGPPVREVLKVIPSMDSQQIEDEAIRWLVRQDGDHWTEAEQVQFDAWIERHLAHRVAYLRVEATWNQCARIRALGAGIPAGVVPERGFWGDRATPG